MTFARLSETFRAAVRTYIDPPPAASPDHIVSGEELQTYMDRAASFPKELLAVFAEIQKLRDENPGLDQWLRDRGIITRERKVRP